MPKIFTAQEMREMANYAMVATRCMRGLCVDNDRSAALQAMLRQAADALERERKYEYAIQYPIGSVSKMHYNDIIRSNDFVFPTKILRRPVGEWEEVSD